MYGFGLVGRGLWGDGPAVLSFSSAVLCHWFQRGRKTTHQRAAVQGQGEDLGYKVRKERLPELVAYSSSLALGWASQGRTNRAQGAASWVWGGLAWGVVWGRSGSPEAGTEEESGLWEVCLRDQYLWKKGERNKIGRRKKSQCDVGLIKPWLAQQEALEWMLPICAAPVGQTWLGLYTPLHSVSGCRLPRKGVTLRGIGLYSAGRPWRSWKPVAVCWPHMHPTAGPLSFLKGSPGGCFPTSIPGGYRRDRKIGRKVLF